MSQARDFQLVRNLLQERAVIGAGSLRVTGAVLEVSYFQYEVYQCSMKDKHRSPFASYHSP